MSATELVTTNSKHQLGFWKSLGNIRAMNRDPIVFFEELREKNPHQAVIPFARIRGREAVFISNQILAHQILTSPRDFGLAELLMRVLSKQFGSEGPFTAGDTDWKYLHDTLDPLFSKDEVLRGPKAQLLHNEVLGLINTLEQAAAHNQAIDILGLAQNTTIAIACKTVIGADLSPRETFECRQDLEGMVLSTFQSMNNPFLLLSPWHYLQTRAHVKRLHRLIYRLMHSPAPNPGFSTALTILQSKFERRHLSEEMFFSALIQLLTAGHETSASAIAWLCRYLALHGAAIRQNQAIQQEAKELAKIGSGTWEYRAYPELTKIVTTVLMRYPPIISVFRQARADRQFEVANNELVTIKKGTLIYIPLLTLNQEQINTSGIPVNAYKTSVFSKGPRMCPGAPLALRTLYSLLAALISRKLEFLILEDHGYQAHLAFKPHHLVLHASRY